MVSRVVVLARRVVAVVGLVVAFFLALALAGPGSARAHELGLSRGDYLVEPRSGGEAVVRATLAFARRDAMALAPGLDADRDGALTEAEMAAGGPALATRVLDGVTVTAGGTPCERAPDGSRLVEEDGLEVRGSFTCRGEGELAIDVSLLDALATGHRHLAKVSREGRIEEAMLHRRDRTVRLAAAVDGGPPPEPAAPPVLAFFVIGIEHIVFGWDHVVFLVGLVLVAGFGERRARGIVLAVTAFTLAHSITLALAVLGLVVPSGEIIEPLIALSVAYVGVENFLVKDPSRRWRVTLPFGLVHGFGFAGALGEVGLPAGQVPAALALFNLGVEAGQLAILAVLLPVVFVLARQPAYARWGVRLASGAIVLAGLFWFAERVIG